MSLHADKSQHFPEALAPGDRSMNYAPLAEAEGSKGQQKFYAADLKRVIRIGIGLHIAPIALRACSSSSKINFRRVRCTISSRRLVAGNELGG